MTVLIAGGGVAGGTAACLLGPVATLVERERGGHDKICGEFVSHEAQGYLDRLGIDTAALGAAAIGRVRLLHGTRMAEAALPFQGLGLTRRALDEALLARAAICGATILRGHTIRSGGPDGLMVDGHGRLAARAIFLATGKHDLRGLRRQPHAPPEELVGLKMYFHLAPVQAAALAGTVEVLLFPGGYAGLQRVEGGLANLCLLIDRARFDAVGSTWSGVQAYLQRECRHLDDRLAGAREALDRPLSIFRVPYGFVHRAQPADTPGLFRLGDQMGVIPSFCGDGISIAMHTAFAAVDGHRMGAPAYHARMERDLSGQIGRAQWLYRAGRARPTWALAAARAWPGALRWIARLTRVPPWALVEV